MPRAEAVDGADVRAAAAAQDEGPLGQVGRDGERLCDERVLLDHRRLGVVERQPRSFHHLLAAVAPGARDAHEAGRERPAARVTLVAETDGDRGVRRAGRALRAEDAHASVFSKTMLALSTVIPTRSYSFVAPVGLSASTPSEARVRPRRQNSANVR